MEKETREQQQDNERVALASFFPSSPAQRREADNGRQCEEQIRSRQDRPGERAVCLGMGENGGAAHTHDVDDLKGKATKSFFAA